LIINKMSSSDTINSGYTRQRNIPSQASVLNEGLQDTLNLSCIRVVKGYFTPNATAAAVAAGGDALIYDLNGEPIRLHFGDVIVRAIATASDTTYVAAAGSTLRLTAADAVVTAGVLVPVSTDAIALTDAVVAVGPAATWNGIVWVPVVSQLSGITQALTTRSYLMAHTTTANVTTNTSWNVVLQILNTGVPGA